MFWNADFHANFSFLQFTQVKISKTSGEPVRWKWGKLSITGMKRLLATKYLGELF